MGHKDGATTLRFYAHYINAEAIAQLDNLEQRNINHLRITDSELQNVITKQSQPDEQLSLFERINTVICNAKNSPYRKSIEMVLNLCEDILCEPLENLSSADKEFLMGTLAQYTFLKKYYTGQEDNETMDTQKNEGMVVSMT